MNQHSPEPKHGRVISPPSRGSKAVELGLLGDWQGNEMEGGKNFPALEAGPFPEPYQTDVASVIPPADGYILSGGKQDARDCVNFTAAEMSAKLGRDFTWPTLNVKPGETFKVQWEYTMPHVTRGYRWFITRDGWDANQRISRAQLEPEPFFTDFYPEVPFDKNRDKLKAKTEHEVQLPTGKRGHHVIVLAWVVADTAVAPAATYYWEYSLDQSTWTAAPDTMRSRTEISGLTPASVYYFRFRALTRTGRRDYSQVVSLVVH